MLINDLRSNVRSELESPPERRRVGTGWVSGTLGMVLSIAGLLFVICLRFPGLLTVPQVRPHYNEPVFRLVLHLTLIAAFALACISLVLRTNRILGFTAIFLTLLATVLGGSHAHGNSGELVDGAFLGLDWFVLNVIFSGLLFIPLERLFARNTQQAIFRDEWREDLFYYFISSMLVQVLTFLTTGPAMAIAAHTSWAALRSRVASQPVLLQLVEIMFFTDLVQYWVHRAFHRVPFLWNFHAVHHSARSMDWLASSRMHFIEILILRGTTVMPMLLLGFSTMALQGYVLLVYVHSALVHANVRWEFNRTGKFLVTPRFHHWHHGIEPEAIDVNFAIHFPLFDRLFGTYHLPPGQWPEGYGVGGHPVPRSYIAQFLYPFVRQRKPS